MKVCIYVTNITKSTETGHGPFFLLMCSFNLRIFVYIILRILGFIIFLILNFLVASYTPKNTVVAEKKLTS